MNTLCLAVQWTHQKLTNSQANMISSSGPFFGRKWHHLENFYWATSTKCYLKGPFKVPLLNSTVIGHKLNLKYVDKWKKGWAMEFFSLKVHFQGLFETLLLLSTATCICQLWYLNFTLLQKFRSSVWIEFNLIIH